MLQKIISKLKSDPLEKKISQVARKVRRNHLTYLSCEKIHNIEECLKETKNNSVSGIFIEAGIALGGSAIIIASLMPEKSYFHGYDVFKMIPPPSEEDDEKSKARYEVIKSGNSKGIGENIYYGYIENLYERVVKNFESFGLKVDDKRVSLHKGLFEDTMHFLDTDKIAFAHIDCDWYEPVRLCLERIYPALNQGGYIVFDDYYDYGGCKKAVDEFLSKRNDLVIVKNQGNLVLERKAS